MIDTEIFLPSQYVNRRPLKGVAPNVSAFRLRGQRVVTLATLRLTLLMTAFVVALAASRSSAAGAAEEQSTETRHEHDAAAIKQQADALKEEQYAIGSRLLQAYPDDFEALRIMGVVHSSHGNKAEMAKCWQRCRDLKPDRADVHDQLGQYSAQVEDYEQAIAYWQQALDINPTFPGLRRQMGSALLQLGRPQDALVHLQHAVEIAPTESESHALLGEARYQLQSFAEAKRSYLVAVKLQPNLSKAWYGLVKVSSRLDQPDEVKKYAERFQQLESAAVKADQEFRKQFDDLKQMRKNVAITCVDAGRLYSREKSLAQVEQLWKRACQLNAQDPTPVDLLAKLYLHQHKVTPALEQLRLLAELEPTEPSVFQRIGFLEAQVGNLPGAERAFKNMLQIAPNHAAGYRSMAKFYLNTKREPKRAEELARKGVELEPVADSYFVLGWSYAVNGKRAAAAAALQKATEMNPNHPTYRKLYDMVRNAE